MNCRSFKSLTTIYEKKGNKNNDNTYRGESIGNSRHAEPKIRVAQEKSEFWVRGAENV